MKDLIRYQQLQNLVEKETHQLKDLLEGRCRVIVEGDSGNDVVRAKQLGLFTCNVKGVDVIAKCAADAAPLVHYIEQGGVYGSEDFSRLLGYSEQQIALYREMIELQSKLKLPPFSPKKSGFTGLFDSESQNRNALLVVAAVLAGLVITKFMKRK